MTALAISESQHLWNEISSLKGQIRELQLAEKQARIEKREMEKHMESFVTQTQLDAFLCMKASHADVDDEIQKLQAALLQSLELKADKCQFQMLHATKLDISVFEASVWDAKKFQNSLEQRVHDLFGPLAFRLEGIMKKKLDISDFARALNFDVNTEEDAVSPNQLEHNITSRQAGDIGALKFSVIVKKVNEIQALQDGEIILQHRVGMLGEDLQNVAGVQAVLQNKVGVLDTDLTATIERVNILHALEHSTIESHERLAQLVAAQHTQEITQLELQRQVQTAMSQDLIKLQSNSFDISKAISRLDEMVHSTVVPEIEKVRVKIDNHLQVTADMLNQMKQSQEQLTYKTGHSLHKINERTNHNELALKALATAQQQVEELLQSLHHELNSVKGPLVTTAENLQQENIAILQEIRRSQNDNRDILLEFQNVLSQSSGQHKVSQSISISESTTTINPDGLNKSSTTNSSCRKHQSLQYAIPTRQRTSTSRLKWIDKQSTSIQKTTNTHINICSLPSQINQSFETQHLSPPFNSIEDPTTSSLSKPSQHKINYRSMLFGTKEYEKKQNISSILQLFPTPTP